MHFQNALVCHKHELYAIMETTVVLLGTLLPEALLPLHLGLSASSAPKSLQSPFPQSKVHSYVAEKCMVSVGLS